MAKRPKLTKKFLKSEKQQAETLIGAMRLTPNTEEYEAFHKMANNAVFSFFISCEYWANYYQPTKGQAVNEVIGELFDEEEENGEIHDSIRLGIAFKKVVDIMGL